MSYARKQKWLFFSEHVRSMHSTSGVCVCCLASNVPICTEQWCTEANEATQTHCYNPVAPSYPIWAYYVHGWQRRCQEDPVGLRSGRLEKTTRSSPHHVAQHRPTGSEITPPYAPQSSRFGSEPPYVEDDVDIWHYAILRVACHKRRRQCIWCMTGLWWLLMCCLLAVCTVCVWSSDCSVCGLLLTWCWQAKLTGHELFDIVCERLRLEERDYFCLSYLDNNNTRVRLIARLAFTFLVLGWNFEKLSNFCK